MKDASRVTITKGGKKVPTGTFFLDLWCPNSAWTHLSWLWEIWCRTIHSPPQTLHQVSAICPWSPHLPGYWRCLPFVFRHTQTGWLSEQRISQMPKLRRCTSCHQQGMPSIHHWEKSSRDPSGDSLHTPCSEGASRADHLSWHGSKLICPSLSQQSSRPGQPQSGPQRGDGGGRPSSVMSLGVTSVGGHSHGHPASPIGVGSSWEDIDPRSPEPLVVRGGWLWLIWVVPWTT